MLARSTASRLAEGAIEDLRRGLAGLNGLDQIGHLQIGLDLPVGEEEIGSEN
jgi:hypothetical protein